jgi:hypothetical protein
LSLLRNTYWSLIFVHKLSLLYPLDSTIIGVKLSEQAKLTYIQEELREARNNEKWGYLLGFLGAVLAGVGFGWGSGLQALGYLGILLAAFGFAWAIFCSYRGSKLREQLKTMATKIPTCPKCGKQIPQGNYTFCPFCGSPLITPSS